MGEAMETVRRLHRELDELTVEANTVHMFENSILIVSDSACATLYHRIRRIGCH